MKGVTIAEVDNRLHAIPDTERETECDTLVLSVGLIPENELSRGLGVNLDNRTGGPVVDENMETSVKGIFACGNVVHVHDLVDHVSESGEIAGRSAGRFVVGNLARKKNRIRLRAGRNVRYVVPQVVSGKDDVKVYLRVKKPARYVLVKVGEEISFPKRMVRPPETVELRIPKGKLVDHSVVISVMREKK